MSTAAIVTVGVVGLAGYAVYKTGEVVVTGVGVVGSGVAAAGMAAADALTPDSKPVKTVVFAGNEVRTEYDSDFESTWKAANGAFQKSGFQAITGKRHVESGTLAAQAWEGEEIHLAMRSLDDRTTEVRIRIGSQGNLRASERVHTWIHSELAQEAAL